MFRDRLFTLTAITLIAVPALAQSPGAAERETAPKMEVAIDEEFTLARQEAALVRDLKLLVTVTELSYTQCPVDAVCVVPDGPVVVFEVRDAGTRDVVFRGNNFAAPPSHFPWFVRYVASDGKTFARFSAHRTVDWCRKRAPGEEATWCWERTAELARDATHCTGIVDKAAQSRCVQKIARLTANPELCRLAPEVNACYESVAAQLQRPALCQKVAQPRGYCVTQAVAASGEIEQCAKLGPPRVDCYIAAARQANSLEVCERLQDPYRWECRNVMKGERVTLPATPSP